MREDNTPPRCGWSFSGPLYLAYHDTEWGVPVHDDRTLFEFLVLEGAQAGLSWSTILNKRAAYRQAFDGFDPDKIARYDEAKVRALLDDAGIVRNALKIRAAVRNSQAFLAVRDQYGTFDAFIWRFVGGQPIQHQWTAVSDIPANTLESDAMSKELKRLGFTFVGTTICYAFMQAVGMVNDHTTNCFRWREIAALAQ